MAGKTWRCLGVLITALGLLISVSGCSLDLILSPPAASPPPAPAPTSGQPASGVDASLVGEEIYHAFSSQENQVKFTVVPAPAPAVAYVGSMGQVGPLDTSATDPTIKSLSLVCNNFTPNDLVNVTFYSSQGTISGTLQVRATGTIDATSYKASSVQLTGTTTDTSTPSPIPVAYLHQMENSAGTTFTYTVPPPLS